jgi:hypothetical protein
LLVLDGPLDDLSVLRPWDEAYEEWKRDKREERYSLVPHGPRGHGPIGLEYLA